MNTEEAMEAFWTKERRRVMQLSRMVLQYSAYCAQHLDFIETRREVKYNRSGEKGTFNHFLTVEGVHAHTGEVVRLSFNVSTKELL